MYQFVSATYEARLRTQATPLQGGSTAMDRQLHCNLEIPSPGIEPGTFSLQDWRSTTEL